MKKIFQIFAITGAALALASCSNLNEVPVFDPNDSFVAFDKAAVAVDENAGKVEIKIKLASIDPINTTIAYQVIDASVDSNYTAKKGENFIDHSNDGITWIKNNRRDTVLVFDIVNPVDTAGNTVFTGDLTFGLKIISANNNINIGAEDLCKVTITDLDHPLAAILGTYNAVGESYFYDTEEWEITLSKDEKSLTTVWIQNLWDIDQYDDTPIYGTISYTPEGQFEQLVIPAGQNWTYNNYSFVTTVYIGGKTASETEPLVLKFDPETCSFYNATANTYTVHLYKDGVNQGPYDAYKSFVFTKK